MDPKKKFIMVIFVEVAILFLLYSYLYRPALKKNFESYKELQSLRAKVDRLEQIPSSHLSIIERDINYLWTFLDRKLPARDVDFSLNLTQGAPGVKFIITSIEPLPSKKFEGYKERPLVLKMKTTLYDFLKYLDYIREKVDILINPKRISISQLLSSKAGMLNIEMTLSAYQVDKKPKSAREFSEEELLGINKKDVDKIRGILRTAKYRTSSRQEFVSIKERNPFKMEGASAEKKPPSFPGGKASSGLQGITLDGIAQAGKRKVALINGKVFKEGDEVSGAKILSIEKNRVILLKGQGKYIIELKR